MSSTAAPSRVGPYEIVSRLGAGGMAETYVALRRGPGGFAQRVCLKRLRPELERDPEFVRQFMAEAAIAARLRHAAIAQVLDFGCDAGEYYLALELIDGCDLRELLGSEGGVLPHGLVLHIGIELTTALDFAHRAGGPAGGTRAAVVHRDVSPSNTLVSSEGEIKLADFGIARSMGATQHTRTGIVKGKVPYMAPEYARNAQLDPRSDLFSLGVLLYECLCGARPHDGATDLETLERASRAERAPLAERARGAPPGLLEIIERLLEPDPALRQQSAAEVLEALLALPPPARARLELGARVADIMRARPAVHDSSAAGEPVATEIMPAEGEPAGDRLAPDQLETRADRARARATPASEPLEVLRPRLRRGPLLALAFALLFALGVVGLAFVRGPAKRTASLETPAPRPSTAPTRSEPQSAHALPAAPPIVVRPSAGEDQATAAAGAPSAVAPGPAALPAAATRSAWLEVVVMPYGQVSIDGKPAGKAPVRIALEPGDHAIEARSKGNTLRRRVSLAADERKQIVLR